MNDENVILRKRLEELANRAETRGCWCFSDFLTLAEQSLFLKMRLPGGVRLFGGYEAAERRLACFGSEDICGYTEEPPVVCLKIAPENMRFADKLTHRDFLGSLMGLGIKREVMGDIVVEDNCGYLFCLESIAPYIKSELRQVRHTTVKCEFCTEPKFRHEETEPVTVNVASERLDAVIAGVYKLSRSESKALVEDGMVYLNGALTENPGAVIAPDTVVSVRHTGRFKYLGTQRETRKGRLCVSVQIY